MTKDNRRGDPLQTIEPADSENPGGQDLEARLSSSLQLVPNPKWIAAQIQNGINVRYVVFYLIINADILSISDDSIRSSHYHYKA